MLNADEDIFNLKYNVNLNKIEIEKRKWTSRLFKTILNHKFISMIVVVFIIFSILNLFLIFNFIRVIEMI